MATKVLGTENPFASGETIETSDRNVATVTVIGTYDDLKTVTAADYCPSGYEVDTTLLTSTEDGMGKLSIRCIKYLTGSAFDALRTTFRIDMAACQYDLKTHPHLASERGVIDKWLATDEAKRHVDGKYYYVNKSGSEVEITSSGNTFAYKFCTAYNAGIETYTRYFPVIEKVSYYNNPPGMSRSGKSFTGGTPTFSSGIGKYDTPPLTLSGYASANWFKSKDSWEEQADKTWRRCEEWTYTPEASSGTNGWVYNQL